MDLEDCVLITDAALSYLAAGCPRLEKLVHDRDTDLIANLQNDQGNIFV